VKSSAPASTPLGPQDQTIGRQLAIGFGLVAVVAIGMCVALLLSLSRVSTVVQHMRRDEGAVRQSLDLATAVREQYIHIAHSIILGNETHLDHYSEWRERIGSVTAALEPEVPAAERWRLENIRHASATMHEKFRDELMPAAESGDITAVRRGHPEIEELAEQAAAHADEVARSVESRMVAAHQRATLATQAGLASGGTCVLLIVALSALYTVRLRRALLRPLKALTQAARRFGAGQFESAIGQIGQGELQAVAVAFDRMAAELAARERRLVESERMAVIGQLAAGVAHELNNSIGIVRGYLKTMDPTGDTQTLKEELGILDEEAGHCQRIADDLLAYAGVQKLELRNVQMSEFLEETMRRLGESDAVTSVELRSAAEEAEIGADPLRLRQVVANLVINAGQASPRGAVVEVSGKRTGSDTYEIIVSDRGPGISDEDKSRIFEPFFSKRRGGTGLGLALCLGVVKAHGGTVAVEDRVGGGTTFRVRLPLKLRGHDPGAPA